MFVCDPFVRLERDEIWEVISLKDDSFVMPADPKTSYGLLRAYDVRGGLNQEIYSQFDDRYISELAMFLLEDNFPVPIQGEILNAIGLNINRTIACSQVDLDVIVRVETPTPLKPAVWEVYDGDHEGPNKQEYRDGKPIEVVAICAKKTEQYKTTRVFRTFLRVYRHAGRFKVELNIFWIDACFSFDDHGSFSKAGLCELRDYWDG